MNPASLSRADVGPGTSSDSATLRHQHTSNRGAQPRSSIVVVAAIAPRDWGRDGSMIPRDTKTYRPPISRAGPNCPVIHTSHRIIKAPFFILSFPPSPGKPPQEISVNYRHLPPAVWPGDTSPICSEPDRVRSTVSLMIFSVYDFPDIARVCSSRPGLMIQPGHDPPLQGRVLDPSGQARSWALTLSAPLAPEGPAFRPARLRLVIGPDACPWHRVLAQISPMP